MEPLARENPLTTPDLADAGLRGLDLSGANLAGANLNRGRSSRSGAARLRTYRCGTHRGQLLQGLAGWRRRSRRSEGARFLDCAQLTSARNWQNAYRDPSGMRSTCPRQSA